MVFNIEEIIRRLEVSPKELRKIANKLEKEQVKTISENEKIQQEYYDQVIKKHNRKCH